MKRQRLKLPIISDTKVNDVYAIGGVTVDEQKGKYKQVGDTYYVHQYFQVNTVLDGTITITIPTPNTMIDQTTINGVATGYDSSINTYFSGNVNYLSPTTIQVVGLPSSSWASAAPFAWASGDYLSVNYSFKAVGLKSSRLFI